MAVKILGAGLSGLSCAINLAGQGFDTVVFEKRPSVGCQIKPNLQGIGFGEEEIRESFRKLNLKPPSLKRKFSKVFFLTPKRVIRIRLPEPYHFVVRGGEESLEYGLCRQAQESGVEFSFNSRLQEKEADVIASGPKKADCVAYGGLFESTSFPADSMLIMFDDRFSPNGWYYYMVPYSKDLVEAVNCVPKPHAQKARHLFGEALKKRPLIRDFMEGARLSYSLSGYGNAFIPQRAVRDGRLYVGEAAGFQDPMMGFGMEYALKSGYLAAESITQKKDYELLWRTLLLPDLKCDVGQRFMLSVLGSRLIEFLYRNFEDECERTLYQTGSKGLAGAAATELLYRLGIARKSLLGYW